ncbi:hypothetical protein [Candidatus Kuenenia stuttgartiensis]|nr:hypothetical protein [Candidatus Kuenenia stuttgartiensis]
MMTVIPHIAREAEGYREEHFRFFVTVCVIGAKQRCKGCGKPCPPLAGD